MRRGFFSMTNVKTHTKHFCKKELWADARSGHAKHERNARARQQLVLKVNGIDTTFTGAFHMDRAPMTLLGTTRSSQEAPPVMRRHVSMSDNGDMVRWVGELQQPNIHHIYRSHFNAVDVHNKMPVGPRSMCDVGLKSLPLKLWLALVAFAETNAYLMYVQHHKLSSEAYSHPDFKLQIERALLERAQQRGLGSEEEGGARTRSSGGSVSRGAQEEEARLGMRTLPTFKGNVLKRDDTMQRKCMICGKKTRSISECGGAVCGSTGGRTCWAWHPEAVVAGTAADGRMQWRRGKQQRH
jgi:hypothetical protein